MSKLSNTSETLAREEREMMFHYIELARQFYTDYATATT